MGSLEQMALRGAILQNGIKTGKIEGKIEGKIDSILKQLEELGEVSDELRLYIQKEKDADVLQTYLKKTFNAQSIEEFEQWIQQESK